MVLQFLHGAGTHYQENIAYQLLSGSQFIGVNGAYFYGAAKTRRKSRVRLLINAEETCDVNVKVIFFFFMGTFL